MNKRALIIYFSQSGQLTEVVQSIVDPMVASGRIELTMECLQPQQPYPFPWPFLEFFDTFPETVHDDPRPIKPLSGATGQDFDLVILAYQVWFLSPSQPVTAFLQSEAARDILRDRPVITVIACRNMWLMAQEKMKQQLESLGARLIDNVVLTDPATSAATFFSTPMWVLTGNKGPFLGGLIPEAGVTPEDIRDATRFGRAIAEQLPGRRREDNSAMLDGLGAVHINEKLIASERIAIRSFRIWGALLRAVGKPGNLLRRLVLCIYILFLITMILTVVPVTALLKTLLAPLTKERTAEQRRYYAAPSGEGMDLVPPAR